MILLLAFAVLGPFALYLVWKAPKLTRSGKLLMAIAIMAYTIVLTYYSYRFGTLMTRHWMEINRQLNELHLR